MLFTLQKTSIIRISYLVGYKLRGVGMRDTVLGTAKGHLLKSRMAFDEGNYDIAASQAIMAFNVAEYAAMQTNNNALQSMIDMAEKKIGELEHDKKARF
jgi:hypothetical protein